MTLPVSRRGACFAVSIMLCGVSAASCHKGSASVDSASVDSTLDAGDARSGEYDASSMDVKGADSGKTAAVDASALARDAASQNDASEDGGESSSPELCRVGQHVCRRFAELDWAGASLEEEPKFFDEYDSGRWERLVTIDPNEAPTGSSLGTSTEIWQVNVPVRTDRPSSGRMGFVGERPLTVRASLQAFRGVWVGRQTDCGSHEPVRLGQTVLRSTDGALLLATGHAPLLAKGEVVFAREEVPEIELSWSEVGCVLCADPYTAMRVALNIKHVVTGASVTIVPGERASISIAGRPYTFMSRATVRPTEQSPCSFAYWTLYREDFWAPRVL
jgi:hypothetical protein